MMKIKLPRGIKYRVETPQPGIVIPGSENEPIITVFGRGSYIQYTPVLVCTPFVRQYSILNNKWGVNMPKEH